MPKVDSKVFVITPLGHQENSLVDYWCQMFGRFILLLLPLGATF